MNYKYAEVYKGEVTLSVERPRKSPWCGSRIVKISEWNLSEDKSTATLTGDEHTYRYLGDSKDFDVDKYTSKPCLTWWKKRPYVTGYCRLKETNPYKLTIIEVLAVTEANDKMLIKY